MIEVTPPLLRRPGARSVLVAVAVVAVMVAAVLMARASDEHPRHAGLRCICSIGWRPPDNAHVHFVGESVVIPARNGARQGFDVGIANDSRLPQIILGLAGSSRDDRARLEISTRNYDRTDLVAHQLPSRPPPLEVPANSVRYLRFSVRPRCLGQGTSLSWKRLHLKVLVGGRIRVETVDLEANMELVGHTTPAGGCY